MATKAEAAVTRNGTTRCDQGAGCCVKTRHVCQSEDKQKHRGAFLDRTKYTSDDQHALEAQKAAANPEAPFETRLGGGNGRESRSSVLGTCDYVLIWWYDLYLALRTPQDGIEASNAGGELHIPRDPNYLNYSNFISRS